MNFKPSIYQSAVYRFIKNEKGNAVIDAVAGSGKSTTIINALKLTHGNTLFLAFNKAIVEELKIKIGNIQNVQVKTLHSLGMSILLKSFKTRVDVNKYKTYIRNGVKYGSLKPTVNLEWNEKITYQNNIIKLVDLARVNLINSIDELREVANRHEVYCIDNEADMVLSIIDWGKVNIKSIDFTDMIFLPNVLKINRFPEFDFVFIDECQDLNAAQRELFLKTVKKTGRFIAVGDPQQAIYGFAGADVNSFNKLKEIPNTKVLPLSVCYRCDNKIIKLAQSIVTQIEAKENVTEGIVNNNAKIADIQDNDLVLCRITSPLVALCMQYIANGTKAYVKGRDIGLNLINMIKRTNRKYIDETVEVLENDLDKLRIKLMKINKCSNSEAIVENQYTAMQDKINAIVTIASDIKTTDEVISRINSIFKDEQKQGICLSTIHKSKGLESDRVFIIRKDKFYLPFAMEKEWSAIQENNLVYVAYTRAKHYLGFVTDFE